MGKDWVIVMRRNRTIVLVVCGLIMIVASVLVFVLFNHKESCDSAWLGMLCLILSEMILSGGLISIEYIHPISFVAKLGYIMVIIGYSLGNMVISFAYIIMQVEEYRIFLTIEIVGAAIFIILMSIMRYINENIKE